LSTIAIIVASTGRDWLIPALAELPPTVITVSPIPAPITSVAMYLSFLLTDRNCHFGIFAVLGQNSVFSPNYDFLQPEQLITDRNCHFGIFAVTDRNCHFGIFAVLGQNSVFSPNYDFLQPEQLIQSQLTTDPITIFRQRRLGEV